MLICIVLGFSSGLPLFCSSTCCPPGSKPKAWSPQRRLRCTGAVSLHLEVPLGALRRPLRRARPGPAAGLDVRVPARADWSDRRAGCAEPCLRHHGRRAAIAALVAFLSATQDIAIDAYRRELLSEDELLGNAVFVNAYKLAGLCLVRCRSSADHLPCSRSSCAITAAFLIPGAILSLWVSEPKAAPHTPAHACEAIIEPFEEFFSEAHG